jgi:hypothetical protein
MAFPEKFSKLIQCPSERRAGDWREEMKLQIKEEILAEVKAEVKKELEAIKKTPE